MLRIVTVNWRNYLGRGAEYANLLHDMVTRNLEEGMRGSFEVFTDDPTGLDPGITPRELPGDLNGWFNKLHLFRDGLFNDGDRIAFFDLDTVITGRLDEIVQYDGDFAILRDAYRPDGLQSSVMLWRANGPANDIWKRWDEDGRPELAGGDQSVVEKIMPNADILQERFPDLFVSYKASNLKKNPPETANVVLFHGLPRPHEILDGWVPQVRKINGITRAELTAQCNTAEAMLHGNIRSAIARDLPWFDLAPAHDGHVVIVGGGPSLKDKLEEIRWRNSLGQRIWALNNVAQYLKNNQIFPDCVTLADARPENADFFDGADPTATYFIASQCDPAVFEALEHHRVILWHCNTPGIEDILKGITDKPIHLFGGGSTVLLNAMTLAFGLGYRKIHLYGADSSYRDGEHHAYKQTLNDSERVVDALCAGKTFKCAPWMVQQASEFERLATELAQDDCIITVAGDGLLPTLAREMMVAPAITPAEARAGEVLKCIAEIERPSGIEVGVFTGLMSKALLQGHPGLTLSMVDSWEGDGKAYQGDSGDWHAGLSQEMQDGFKQQAMERTEFANGHRIVFHCRSTDAAARTADGSQDFIFIDADHSYEGCKTDLEAWAPKVKPGGWLCGHDYENTDFPKFGVTEAVNEFAAGRGLNIELGENFTWFIRGD